MFQHFWAPLPRPAPPTARPRRRPAPCVFPLSPPPRPEPQASGLVRDPGPKMNSEGFASRPGGKKSHPRAPQASAWASVSAARGLPEDPPPAQPRQKPEASDPSLFSLSVFSAPGAPEGASALTVGVPHLRAPRRRTDVRGIEPHDHLIDVHDHVMDESMMNR